MNLLFCLVGCLLTPPATTVDYTLTVDSADWHSYAVEMRIHHAPPAFRVALARHPEYDDQFWRRLRDVQVTAPARLQHPDSAVWQITGAPTEATIRYRISLPAPPAGNRPCWQPFLTPTGGLVGAYHSFLYVIGAEAAPARLTLRLPAGWAVATGLPATGLSATGPLTYQAASFAELMDAPLLIGRLRHWHFAVEGVPHHVAYWPRPDATPFDTATLVSALAGLVRQSHALFGSFPYRSYTFLLQDGAYGALEHATSVTIGVPSTELATDRADFLSTVAHEYFHTWNLVGLHPAGWGTVTWQPPAPTTGLWWSEGVTLYFADLLLRRAHLLPAPPTRAERLAHSLSRYLSEPGNTRIAPERASFTTNDPPAAGTDVEADFYLQGELLGTALDLILRDSTAGRHTLDDLMRALYHDFAGPKGFTSADLARTASRVCGCRLGPFFDQHVRAAAPLDFTPWLRPLGLTVHTTTEPATDEAGQPLPDLRIWAYPAPRSPTQPPRLLFRLSQPTGAWARAGLHTADQLLALNGQPVADLRTLRTTVRALHVGDSLQVDYQRGPTPFRTTVHITGYDRTKVTITARPDAIPEERARRERWEAAMK